jgi:hypothetical protein
MSPRDPVYIDAPNYTPTSNGIRCIYFLAQQLAAKGAQVVFIPRQIRGFMNNLPQPFEGFDVAPGWSMSDRGTLICSESAPAGLITQARSSGVRIIWWYLAPHGLLERPSAQPRLGEKIIFFSSYVMPDCHSYFYFQPPLDASWKHALSVHRTLSSHKPLELALYCGKGRLRELPENLRLEIFNSNLNVITRSYPPSREQLFSVLFNLDGLITFDELSQLSLEAASLGIPVFLANPLFPKSSADSFPVPLSSFLTRDSHEFLELMEQRRSGRLKAIRTATLFTQNQSTVAQLMALVSDPKWNCTDADILLMERNKDFGRQMKRKRVLYPHYGGQSAGTFFLSTYITSIFETTSAHRRICRIISAVDELGRLLNFFGAGSIYVNFIYRTKKVARQIKRLKVS